MIDGKTNKDPETECIDVLALSICSRYFAPEFKEIQEVICFNTFKTLAMLVDRKIQLLQA